MNSNLIDFKSLKGTNGQTQVSNEEVGGCYMMISSDINGYRTRIDRDYRQELDRLYHDLVLDLFQKFDDVQ